MKLRPRLSALEAKTNPRSSVYVICGTPEEAERQAQATRTPDAILIVTGVPRAPKAVQQ